MGQQRDRELEEYLRGNSATSRAYRRLKSARPPEQIDTRVLRMARQTPADSSWNAKIPTAATRRRPLWFAPFALTASVILSVAVVLAVVFPPMKQHHTDGPVHWVHASAHRVDRLHLREPPTAVLHADADTQPQDPHSWLIRIRELRREGRHLEADAEYRRFRAAFPNYVSTD